MTVEGALTWLFVPGDRPERYAKAAASGADIVIIDLQDAVALSAKAGARRSARDWLAEGGRACVRINPIRTAEGLADLAALADIQARANEWSSHGSSLQAVMLPLIEDPADLDIFSGALPDIPAVLLVESARGLANLRHLCAHPAARRVAFGNLDMAGDLGCDPTSVVLAAARSAIVVESRVADLPSPIDGVTTDFMDPGAVRRDASSSRLDGFGGKLCIHPRQVDVVRAAYRPTEDELLWAASVEDAIGTSEAGAVSLDGAMLDAPVLRRARDILARGAGLTAEVDA